MRCWGGGHRTCPRPHPIPSRLAFMRWVSYEEGGADDQIDPEKSTRPRRLLCSERSCVMMICRPPISEAVSASNNLFHIIAYKAMELSYRMRCDRSRHSWAAHSLKIGLYTLTPSTHQHQLRQTRSHAYMVHCFQKRKDIVKATYLNKLRNHQTINFDKMRRDLPFWTLFLFPDTDWTLISFPNPRSLDSGPREACECFMSDYRASIWGCSV